MTKEEQEEFVLELSQTVVTSIISKIRKGKIPKDWDGFEFRQLLKEKFEEQVYVIKKERFQKYVMETIINDI